ncbi:PAS domain S-box-containing protein [Bacillus sp. SLBN-46]|uniref:sigma 54-interacting transcriptional regulator n=1 Tax=Bacillus sp. SLBN-46 TaxID=3042283 RepID=UPI002863CB9E|nr:sigma 54-interacting transcriptional regulator [Bacillus sp. SLBN-46]MDR6120866.1 PAS domain S-box-containing protein [Bacillus sp. SLBN-46]
MRLFSTDSIEDAVEMFRSSDKDVLEVENDQGHVIGYFTKSDLNEAVQKGRLHEPIGQLISMEVDEHVRSSIQHTEGKEYIKLIESHVFSDIIDSLYDGVFITDGRGIPVKVNKAYERITDITADKVIGFHMSDLVKAGFYSKSASMEVIKSKWPVTVMQTLRNDRKIIVSGTPIFNRKREILYVINSVRDITELLRLKLEIEDLQQLKLLRQSSRSMIEERNGEEFIAVSEAAVKLYAQAERVAKTDAKVLLNGESGVGKTLIAKYIHENSNRQGGAFLELNCGAFPASLIEAELFGYEAGAFTGALTKGKKGLFEVADNGTLFLDEIGDLPLEVQVKLLKVIEEQAFIPVGGSKVKKINVRIIAATNKDLKGLVKEGRFREDLYYRLNVVPIYIPPLRHRLKDLLPLIQYYLNFFNTQYQCQKEISIEALDFLHQYDWPGNIRELRNIIERLVVLTIHDTIDVKDLPEEIKPAKTEYFLFPEEILPLKQAVDILERELITKALKRYKTTRKAAEVLKVSQSAIVQKMKKWNQND